MYYAQLGMLGVRSGMEAEVDAMLRRANFKVRHGRAGEVDLAPILSKSVAKRVEGVEAVDDAKAARWAQFVGQGR